MSSPQSTGRIDAMPIAYLAEQFEFPGNLPETLPDVAPEAPAVGTVAELLVTVATLQIANAKLLAERRPSVPDWMALKSVSRGPYSYEAVRQWCVAGLIIAEKRRGRWFVQVGSMVDRLKELAASGR